MSLISFAKETFFRLNASTPKYFRDLRLTLKWIAGSAAAIDVYANSHPFFISVVEKFHVYTACQWVLAASLCGMLGASLPTDDTHDDPALEEEHKAEKPIVGPTPGTHFTPEVHYTPSVVTLELRGPTGTILPSSPTVIPSTTAL